MSTGAEAGFRWASISTGREDFARQRIDPDVVAWPEDGDEGCGQGVLERYLSTDPTPQAVRDQLIVVGAHLLGGLTQTAVRRRLAMLSARLAPGRRESVCQALAAPTLIDSSVSRRVSEVYCRLARERHSPGDEFALVGLYFICLSAAWREGRELRKMEALLPSDLGHRMRGFHRSCLRSGQGELVASIVAIVAQILGEKGNQGSGDD